VQPENLRAGDLARSAKESIARLGVDQVDLLLIHWPNAAIPLAETIGALNKVKRDGLTKHIGVSNFNVALIEEATKLSESPLVCDQVEYHPFLDQTKVIAACKTHDMAVVAYSPIARGGAEGDKVLGRIAKAHGKSSAQISLRWLVQQGVVVIPRTSKAERLKENIALFDFELTAAEMKEIAGLARGGRIVNWVYSPKWD
jgi:diketogulonate reductase-like aldo/keto reductase